MSDYDFPDLSSFSTQIETQLKNTNLDVQTRKDAIIKIWEAMELEAESEIQAISLENGRYLNRPVELDKPKLRD